MDGIEMGLGGWVDEVKWWLVAVCVSAADAVAGFCQRCFTWGNRQTR